MNIQLSIFEKKYRTHTHTLSPTYSNVVENWVYLFSMRNGSESFHPLHAVIFHNTQIMFTQSGFDVFNDLSVDTWETTKVFFFQNHPAKAFASLQKIGLYRTFSSSRDPTYPLFQRNPPSTTHFLDGTFCDHVNSKKKSFWLNLFTFQKSKTLKKYFKVRVSLPSLSLSLTLSHTFSLSLIRLGHSLAISLRLSNKKRKSFQIIIKHV